MVMPKTRKPKQHKPGNKTDTKRSTKLSNQSRNPSSKDQDLPSLRDREPETFHIYATSDSSDDEIKVQAFGVSAKHPSADEESDSAQEAVSSYNENDEPRSKRDTSPTEDTSQKSMPPSSHVPKPKRRKSGDQSDQPGSQDPRLGFASVNSGLPAETPAHDLEDVQRDITILANGRWPCPHDGCNATFANKKGSTRHAKSHLEPHFCGVCGKGFGRFDTLQRHLRKHHPEEQNTAAEAAGDAITIPQNHHNSPDDAGEFETAAENSERDATSHDEDSAHEPNTPVADRLQTPDPTSPHHPPSSGDSDHLPADFIEETPVAETRQKRKRDSSNSPQPASSRPRKRKRDSSHNNLSSIQSEDGGEVPEGPEAPTRSQKRRQSGIDEWAQRSTPSSTQNMSLVVPRLTKGQSSKHASSRTPIPATGQKTHLNSDGLHHSAYTSSNGKGRAEPGLTYTSPAKSNLAKRKKSNSGMATSIATRTFSTPASSITPEDENEDSGSASDHGLSSEGGIETVQVAAKSARTGRYKCDVCLKQFTSEKLLNRHLRRPNVHIPRLSCPHCSATFVSKAKLRDHIAESGHTPGGVVRKSKGGFSDTEVERLNRWRSRFSEEHHISIAQFNDMMTDTLQRTPSRNWKWPFIGAKEFLKEYMAVLPYRDNRSMLRYRERNFQNLAGSQNWTEEDDQDLVRLVKQYGTSWAKIGKILTRTADAVSQRWRHKLQHAEAALGEWTQDELERLDASIEQVRRASGPPSTNGEWHIPWTQVSAIMKTRTPQQCSNRWRSIHSVKKDGVWVHVPGLKKTPGSSRVITSSKMVTPSKMERRLQGSTRQKPAPLSEVYVQDEDSDAEDEAEEAVESHVPEEHNPGIKPVKTPSAGESRNPLTSKTPGKTLGSSQLFHQTQIDTSALKPPPSRSRGSGTPPQTQDRPSPNIAIQRRPVSISPLQEIALHRETVPDGGENQSTTDEEGSDAESEQTTSADSGMDTDSEQSEDKAQIRGQIAATSMGEDQGSETDTSPDDDEESEESVVDRVNTAEPSMVDDEADETSSDLTSSEEEDQDGVDGEEASLGSVEADDQVEDAGQDDEDDEDVDYNDDGSDDDNRAQFMSSIAKSAVRGSRSALNGRRLLSKGKKRSRTSSGDEDSDESDESD